MEEAIKRSELFPCAESPKMNAGGVLSTSESLIRRFREIVKPYLNNVARCSSDVVLFLTRHVLFLVKSLVTTDFKPI